MNIQCKKNETCVMGWVVSKTGGIKLYILGLNQTII